MRVKNARYAPAVRSWRSCFANTTATREECWISRTYRATFHNVLLFVVNSFYICLFYIQSKAYHKSKECLCLGFLLLKSRIVRMSLLQDIHIEEPLLMKKEIPSIDWFVALGHANTIMRTTAVEALGKSGLLTALRHPEWTIRQAAAVELAAFIPMHDVQEALTTTLFSDEDSLIRATIVRTLSYLGQQTPIDSLVKALQNEKDDWEVREMILSVFGDLAELAPLEPIIASLQDPEELVRAVAVRTLGKYKRNIPIKPLVDALFDTSPMVQEQAATILWNSNEQGQSALLQVCTQEPDDPITSLVHRLRSQQQGHMQQLFEQVDMFLHLPQSFSHHNDGEDIPTNSLKLSDEQRFADNLYPLVESDDIHRQKQSSMKRQIDNQHTTEAKRHYAEGEAIMPDTTPHIDPPDHVIPCTSPKKRRCR